MSFNNLTFIFLFFPLFLITYYLVPRTLQNVILVIGSLLFYWYGVSSYPWMLLLLFCEILFTWLMGLALGSDHLRTPLLTLSMVILFGLLALFKYDTLVGLELAFPLAVSFYTFQMAAYLFDVYRGKLAPEPSFITYAAGVLMFIKLLSGPLMAWDDIFAQLKKRRYSWANVNEGLRDFIVGLSLKVLVADSLGGIWSQITAIGISSISTPMAWLGMIGYSLQLYFDFYGYSKMAIGLGRMIGFELPDNFTHPYVSHTVGEFWRRWHITLGTWFKNYIYIPLGGSRRGTRRTIINLLVVWVFTGIWHGSTGNFPLWGFFLFLCIASEKLWTGKFFSQSKIISHFYLLLAIGFGWVIFAIPDMKELGTYFLRMFGLSKGALSYRIDFLPQLRSCWLFLIAGVALSTEYPAKLWSKYRSTFVSDILLFLLFWMCVYRMSVGLNDPFMYFSF